MKKTSLLTISAGWLTLVFSLPILAQPGSLAAGSVQDTPNAEAAYAQDAAYLVAEYGFSTTDAVAIIKRQSAVGLLEGEMRRRDDFAGMFIEYQPGYAIVILTMGQVVDMEAAVAETMPSLVQHVNVQRATYSEAAMVRYVHRVTEKLRDVSYGSDIDIVNGTILFVAETERDREAIAAAARGEALDGASLEIRVANHPFEITDATCTWGDNDICGGEDLKNLDDLRECTSGFTVNDGNGHEGIVTAGHCRDAVKHEGVQLDYQDGGDQGSHDAQWHLTPSLPDLPKVRDGNNPPRNITAKANRGEQTVNTVVCKFGGVTGYGCGELRSKNYDPPQNCTQTSNPQPTYMRVDQDQADFGDSGGPVMVGPSAWGLIKGKTCDFNQQYYYMAQNYMSFLGVEVSFA